MGLSPEPVDDANSENAHKYQSGFEIGKHAEDKNKGEAEKTADPGKPSPERTEFKERLPVDVRCPLRHYPDCCRTEAFCGGPCLNTCLKQKYIL